MQAKNKENTESLAAFAHRLSLLAGRKRLKQVEIARLLSTDQHVVSPQRVGGWFQGRHFPGGEVEHALAALLGVPRDWLIEGKESTDSTGDEPLIAEGPQAPYGTAGDIETEIRRQVDEVLHAAKGDVKRLGWVHEQVKEHVAIPKSWRTNEELNRRAYELLHRANAERARSEAARRPPAQGTEKSA